MRAAFYDQLGEPDAIRVGDQPVPERSHDQVLIRVRAAGVGFWDVKQMRGVFGRELPFPVIPGYEAAGVVAEEGDSRLRPGDEVVASLRFPGGGLAEYAAAPANRVVPKPAGLGDEETAALVVSAGTALEGLEDRAELRPGQTLLVTAAAGGVGTAAVQIARADGARVLAIASAENHGLLRDLGAAETYDYHDDDWLARVRAAAPDGVDALLDNAGGRTGEQALAAVRPGGRAVLIAGVPDNVPDGVEAIDFSAVITGRRLQRVLELAAAGQLRPVIDSVYPLDHARQALEHVAGRHLRGRVLLTVA